MNVGSRKLQVIHSRHRGRCRECRWWHRSEMAGIDSRITNEQNGMNNKEVTQKSTVTVEQIRKTMEYHR
jgi:Zn-finger protein